MKDAIAVFVCAILAFAIAGGFVWHITHGGGYAVTPSWIREYRQ